MNSLRPPPPRTRRSARPTRLRARSLGALAALVAALVLPACDAQTRPRPATGAPATAQPAAAFPDAPKVTDGPLDPRAGDAVARFVSAAAAGALDRRALDVVVETRDARLGWLVSDALRFTARPKDEEALVAAFVTLTGVDVRDDPAFAQSAWLSVTNHLIAWDLPAPPSYRERKAELFAAIEPGWAPFFADAGSDIDWRLVSWGGVQIDDRRAGDREPCPRGCIPALDDPALTGARAGDWYPDGRTVFGVIVGDEAVAFPKNIMEVHEMVNVTVGGRRLGIPYCTLCGSAQAYDLDSVPEGVRPPVLRTSGLLSRSNKLMYDLNSSSAIDTFTGRALSGRLQDARVVLEQVSVVTSSWGAWKKAHPRTRIVAQDGGIGRRYAEDPLGGRDEDGPIFPIGAVDPRLPVQAQVLGVVTPDGQPVAFPADQARAALDDGKKVRVGAVELLSDGGGLRARSTAGATIPAHQAFWFAWSQFHPSTRVWTPLG